jgi:serine/threonine protein kinase
LAKLRAPFEATTHFQLATKIKAGNVERLPSQYSEDLWKVIQRMLTQDANLRPSASELLNLPQLQVRTKTSDSKELYEQLKKRETDLAKKEKEVRDLEELVKTRQEEIKKREEKLRMRETRILENQENIRQALQTNGSSSASMLTSGGPPGGPIEKGGVPASI